MTTRAYSENRRGAATDTNVWQGFDPLAALVLRVNVWPELKCPSVSRIDPVRVPERVDRKVRRLRELVVAQDNTDQRAAGRKRADVVRDRRR